MAEIIRLRAGLDAAETHALMLELQERMANGEDLGPRAEHIKRVAAAMRVQVGALVRVLHTPDEDLDVDPEIRTLAEKVVVLAEQNLWKAEELLRAIASDAAKHSGMLSAAQVGEMPST